MTPARARRDRLDRDHVLRAAVGLADERGLDALSMRTLAERLGVVPMALYKHVTGKDDLLDAMVDDVVAEIVTPGTADGWRAAVRGRVLSARDAMLRHPWAPRALETRTTLTPAVLTHLDATIGLLRAAGFSDVLTHHAMHALGSRVWGFTHELYAAPAPAAEPPPPEVLAALAARYPHVAAAAAAAAHAGATVGGACDDQFEFEFALDLVLDGVARLHDADWRPPGC